MEYRPKLQPTAPIGPAGSVVAIPIPNTLLHTAPIHRFVVSQYIGSADSFTAEFASDPAMQRHIAFFADGKPGIPMDHRGEYHRHPSNTIYCRIIPNAQWDNQYLITVFLDLILPH